MYVVYNWVDTTSEKKTKIFKQLVFATVLWVRPSFPETYINKSRIEYLHEPSRGFESSGEMLRLVQITFKGPGLYRQLSKGLLG